MNLFAKIFIGFWVSTAAIIASWLLASQYFDPYTETVAARAENPPLPGEPRMRHLLGPPTGIAPAPPPRNMFRIYYGLQNVSAAELPVWIRRMENNEDIRIFLIDADGKEIFGRELVPGTGTVLKKLTGFRRRATHREDRTLLFGQELYRPEWGALNLVIASRLPASPIVKLLTEHLWLRLLLALLISGGISYAVSRYLTRPLKSLQQTSRELAGGNLAARIKVSARGGDETDELARDFNTMAEQLQEKVQAQRRLLNDVSHELRSPLARLRVALALAEREPQGSAEQLQRIETETGRLDELIGQLLSVPDNHTEMEDSIDVVGLLRELCADASYEVQTERKLVKFESMLDEAVVRSHGDLLKKALENIIRNAMHYTAPDTTVSVELKAGIRGLEIQVQDAGPGIPESDLERIFEPFYRLDEARQRETGGIGLGLSIARRAIEQHRGSISAQNREDGLQVTVFLPADSGSA